jgi:adenylyl-sulfate kinase
MRKKGFTVWFTGLSGSGKSTLAKMLNEELTRRGVLSEILDGDEIRKRLTKGLGFSRADRAEISRADRAENINRIAFVAGMISKVGGVAVTAAISPYREAREKARKEIQNFVEVYVKCPIEVCMKRDPKGLYAKALRGEIQNFTGVSDPYEEPSDPEIIVHSSMQSPQESNHLIIQKLEELGYLSPPHQTPR